MRSIIACANAEVETSVAPSIRRAKSQVTCLSEIAPQSLFERSDRCYLEAHSSSIEMMRGVMLGGGSGPRLEVDADPRTDTIPLYDRPMVIYAVQSLEVNHFERHRGVN